MKRFLSLFLLVVALAAGAACNTARPAAAAVDGDDISQDELNDELDAINENDQYLELIQQEGFRIQGRGPNTFDMNFVSQTLTRQILYRLIHDELERRDLAVTDGDLQAAQSNVERSIGGADVFRAFPEGYRRTLIRRQAEVTKLQDELSDVEVDEAAIKSFYDQNQQLFSQTCVSHILFAVTGEGGQQIDEQATAAAADRLKAEADAVRAQLGAGGDFNALAAQHSKDPSNATQGGTLGCNPPGTFLPEFETAMDALAINDVSQPVQTRFGFHLIKVTSRDPQSLEDATPQIQQRLQSDAQQALSEFLREKVSSAKITVNPRYGTFQADGPAPGIVPPTAPSTTLPGQGSSSLTDDLTLTPNP